MKPRLTHLAIFDRKREDARLDRGTSMAQTLHAWTDEARKGTREDFARRFTGAFLVVVEQPTAAGEPQSIISTGKMPALRPGQTTIESCPVLVHTVAKRPGLQSPFPTMVTIGRAANNDIVLPAAGVSLFHAYLSRDGERWVIRDADSSHGTYVDEVRVAGPTPLALGVTLKFAEVRCRFVDAAGLYRLALFGL